MNAIVPSNFGKVSTKFATAKFENDLAAGVQSGFGLVGYKGKVWSIRHRGEEQQLLREDGDGPRNSIEVVILKGAPYISKIWYEKGYVEGSTAAPDCFSPNGVVPDPQSAKKQSNACASCPQNAWGSRITDAGKKGKACSDSKRLAVTPLGDIPNETYGGPLLLRVPAASLQDLATYGNKMQNLGYPYFAIATRISFDANEAYPKFTFSPIRPLTDEEADMVVAMQSTEEVKRVLAEGSEHAEAAPEEAAPDVGNVFEQPVATKPAAKPVTKPAVKAATKPAVTEPEEAEAKPAAKANGFGAVSPKATTTTTTTKTAAKPRTPPVIPDEEEEEVVAASEEEEASEEEQSDFEASLDEQLANLLAD